MQRKLFLFGTGKIAKKYTEFFNGVFIDIEGYIDNDKNKWGTYFYNKKIYGPEELQKIANPDILIACAAEEEISMQLSEMNLEKYIVPISKIISYYGKIIGKKTLPKDSQKKVDNKTIIIDNFNGSWGGAEDWCHIVAESLIHRKREVYIVERTNQPYIVGLEKNIKRIHIDKENECPLYIELIEFLMVKKPFILFNVWNSELLWAAVAVKSVYPEEALVISSILNDTVYKNFCEWDKNTSMYLCISSKIQQNLINRYNIERVKVCFRSPFVEKIRKVEKIYQFENNKPLRIGYPCRLEKFQKRADLIPNLIEFLEERKINYTLNIAGNGSYEVKIKEYVKKNNLHEKVHLYGKLSRAELFNFLNDQDIYINFSEFEGTSLTMLESMASGCVPIATNVSGVSDFIQNGVNGFIVDIGDLEKISEYVAFFDKHRHILAEYGERCMSIVQEKCRLDHYIDDIEEMIDSM